jgi:hypothetical protein
MSPESINKMKNTIQIPPAILKCKYGPGRGNTNAQDFTVGPSGLHCSSLVNLVLSWLLDAHIDYDPLGNIPAPVNLLLDSENINWKGLNRKVRGLSDNGKFKKIGSIFGSYGDLVKNADHNVNIIVWEQSTKLSNGKWKWGHHVGLLIRQEDGWYRLAADGSRNAKGIYSGTPVSYTKVYLTQPATNKKYRGWALIDPIKPNPKRDIVWVD